MSVTITHQPNPFFFARNEQMIEATLSGSQQGGSPASARINIIAQQPDSSTFSLSNALTGLNISWTFVNTPASAGQRKRYNATDFGTIQNYARTYFIPELLKETALRENYRIEAQYPVSEDLAIIDIIAKTNDGDLDLTGSSSIDTPIDFVELTPATNDNTNQARLRADVIVKYIRYSGTSTIFEESLNLGPSYAETNKAGKAILFLSNIVQSAMSPLLLKGRKISQVLTDVPKFALIVRLTVILTEEKISGDFSGETTYLNFTSILGGLPAPATKADEQPYYLQSSGTPYPRILSNQPQNCRISPLVVLTHSYVNLNPWPGHNPGFRVIRIDANGNEQPFTSIDNFPRRILVGCYFAVDYRNSMQITELRIVPANTSESINTSPNQLTLNIDYRSYEHQNFFFFTNALGGSDLAWLTGALEVEMEGDFIEYQTMPTAPITRGSHTKKTQFQGLDQTFRISTGFKSAAEIQWLTELLTSEEIHWYTLDQMARHIAFVSGTSSTPADFRVIRINKSSIRYYDSKQGAQFFTFEFSIANTSPAIHTL